MNAGPCSPTGLSLGILQEFGAARDLDRHPTLKMLALSFLVLIGTNLVAEGFGVHIPKGYTYFAMAFSVAVEMLNLRLRRTAGRRSSAVGADR